MYGDVLFHPFNDSKEDLLWGDLSPVHSGNFGGMVGVTFPLCVNFCIWPSLMGGYLPAPGSALFGFGLGG